MEAIGLFVVFAMAMFGIMVFSNGTGRSGRRGQANQHPWHGTGTGVDPLFDGHAHSHHHQGTHHGHHHDAHHGHHHAHDDAAACGDTSSSGYESGGADYCSDGGGYDSGSSDGGGDYCGGDSGGGDSGGGFSSD